MRKVATLIVCALAFGADASSAQTSERDRLPGPVLERAASSNWYLRVVTDAQADTIAGRVRMANHRFRIGDAWVEPATIRSLERRIEEGSGALIGGLVGAVALGVLAERLSHWNEPADGSTNFMALGLGAGAGAMFGMFAGHAIHPGRVHWESVWPEQ